MLIAAQRTNFETLKPLAVKYSLILLGTAVLAVILTPLWADNVYLVHTALELACIFFALSIFLLVWNTFDKTLILNNLLGFGFITVTFFDLLHTYYFFGVKVFGQGYPDLHIRYLIVGRLIEAAILLTASAGTRKGLATRWQWLALAALACFGLYFLIYQFPGIMPLMNTSEYQTPDKISLEYVVVGISLISIYNLRNKLDVTGTISYRDLLIALMLIIPAELMFTADKVMASFYSTAGHILKASYFYYLYQTVFVNAITDPYNRSEETNRSIVAAMAEGVIFIGADGRIVNCNASAERILGLPCEQIMGRIPSHLQWQAIHEDGSPFPPDTYPATVTLKSGIPQLGVVMGICRPAGTSIWLSINSEPLLRPDGKKPYGVVVTFTDITARKRDEEKLRESRAHFKAIADELAETNSELNSFVSTVAHDFRAPMVNLKGFNAELGHSLAVLRRLLHDGRHPIPPAVQAQVDDLLEKDIAEARQFIGTSADRLDRMIDVLLDLSTMARWELVPVEIDLRQLVDAALEPLSRRIGDSKVSINVGPLPTVRADLRALERIFANLLDNAVKYLDPRRPGKITVDCADNKHEYIISIRDNGRGIAADDQEKIFSLFRRAGSQDQPGDGLGLAYVRTVVRKLGGKVWCESHPGVGTSIRFTLPKTPPPSA